MLFKNLKIYFIKNKLKINIFWELPKITLFLGNNSDFESSRWRSQLRRRRITRRLTYLVNLIPVFLSRASTYSRGFTSQNYCGRRTCRLCIGFPSLSLVSLRKVYLFIYFHFCFCAISVLLLVVFYLLVTDVGKNCLLPLLTFYLNCFDSSSLLNSFLWMQR